MKTPYSGTALLMTALLAIRSTARSAAQPTLKDAYKDHFYVGVAIDRIIATDISVRARRVLTACTSKLKWGSTPGSPEI